MECSVVTEFTDHICVTMDAELIMFLHDLVSAYLKEKEKGWCLYRNLSSTQLLPTVHTKSWVTYDRCGREIVLLVKNMTHGGGGWRTAHLVDPLRPGVDSDTWPRTHVVPHSLSVPPSRAYSVLSIKKGDKKPQNT